MQKTLTVTVDDSTWSANAPNFPRTFHSGDRQCDFNIPALLLALGFLTTPPRSAGASLSEYWAWVRYFCAISNEPDLRLAREFFQLDPHQKTILSDDFGMAIPIYWLFQKLNLGPIAHGLYFIEHIAEHLGATAARPAKRGPRKSPDFVAMDASGKWHVIECKGTQSGIAYRNRQLGDPDNPANGAVSQKRTITFPHAISGQRLACGLSISFEEDDQPSNLRIIDPSEEETFTLEESHESLAKDAVWRAVGGRALLLSGFRSASSSLVDPFGRFERTGVKRKQDIERRREAISHMTSQVTEELGARDQNTRFTSVGLSYYGRHTAIELPRSVDVGGTLVHSVRVNHGVNGEFLDELTQYPVLEDPLHESDAKWQELIGSIAFQYDSLQAAFKIGTLFHSEVTLEP